MWALQDFWDVMDDLDRHCVVMEPQAPSRKDTKRRIWLSKTSSLLVVVNPSKPREIPTCHFLGSDKAVAPLKRSFSANSRSWNANELLRHNLETVLELRLPETRAGDDAEENGP